jgi:shikimate dehydrogenase
MSASHRESHRAACVIGWPAAHSRSPLIHNYWIRQYGLDADYRREAVPPEEFASFLQQLAQRGYVGANVTLPHKEEALARSQPDEHATKVGAANTLWLDGETLHSTNTDVEGFLANLDAQAPGWDRALDTAMVLGAGGAARAVVSGLLERGVQRLYIANRSFERAVALEQRFGSALLPVRWEEADALLPGSGLLVNTTSLGMHGQPTLHLDVTLLPASAVVADIVYVPLDTALLATAKARGLRTADGLGMLLHQAVRGFSLWFGVTPDVTPQLRALVEADIAGETSPRAQPE